MRLLVTGASGFLGRNVLVQAPRDWDIVAVYHDALDFPEFVAHEGLVNVRAIRCDLTNASDVSALRATAGQTGPVDAALYLAANGDPAASARDPLRDLRLNTVALLTFLEHCPVPRLVYLSSGAVYDGLVGHRHAGVARRAASAVRDFEARLRGVHPVLRGSTRRAGELRQRAILRRIRSVRAAAQDHHAVPDGGRPRRSRVHAPRRRAQPDRLHVRGRCRATACWRSSPTIGPCGRPLTLHRGSRRRVNDVVRRDGPADGQRHADSPRRQSPRSTSNFDPAIVVWRRLRLHAAGAVRRGVRAAARASSPRTAARRFADDHESERQLQWSSWARARPAFPPAGGWPSAAPR